MEHRNYEKRLFVWRINDKVIAYSLKTKWP